MDQQLQNRVVALENTLSALTKSGNLRGVNIRKLDYFYGETANYTIDTGDTAWMLTSTALVLFMTLPGLALYYGGMVMSFNYIIRRN